MGYTYFYKLFVFMYITNSNSQHLFQYLHAGGTNTDAFTVVENDRLPLSVALDAADMIQIHDAGTVNPQKMLGGEHFL
ncbi:hypothetical protein FACS1894199_00260 [Bacteroidia bacterium]|nr:hypothetical protein FACS1894199_00260 [Bacteroidia bacterium]